MKHAALHWHGNLSSHPTKPSKGQNRCHPCWLLAWVVDGEKGKTSSVVPDRQYVGHCVKIFLDVLRSGLKPMVIASAELDSEENTYVIDTKWSLGKCRSWIREAWVHTSDSDGDCASSSICIWGDFNVNLTCWNSVLDQLGPLPFVIATENGSDIHVSMLISGMGGNDRRKKKILTASWRENWFWVD